MSETSPGEVHIRHNPFDDPKPHRPKGMITALALAAILHGADQIDANRFTAQRRVIDVSGDGSATSGLPARLARDRVVARGFTVNGLPILTEMAASGDGWKGKIYDPKSGKTYRAVVARDGANLKVQGCIAIFCQTMIWTRVG